MGWLGSHSYGDTRFSCAAFIQLDHRLEGPWLPLMQVWPLFLAVICVALVLFLVTSHHPTGQMTEFLTRQFQGSVLRKWKGKLKELYRQPPKLYYPFCHNLLVKASHETNVQVRDGKIDFTPWWKETKVTETKIHPRTNKFQSKTYHVNSTAMQEHNPEH